MTSGVRRVLDAIVDRAYGFPVRATVAGMGEGLTRLETAVATLAEHTHWLEIHAEAEREWRRLERDDIEALRTQLAAVRQARTYDAIWDDPEPLISVRMAAWRKTEELVDVAIASVLRQTYQRFEIVIVNDGPNPATRAALEKLGDPRIRYAEFPEQQRYPAHPQLRWMVAGAPGMNRAAELATGTWIAPLDDDDEFSDDHLEKLLEAARGARAELAYGAIAQKHLSRGEVYRIWSDPPAINQFSFMGAMYLAAIGFIRYDERSWAAEEPADWNLMRRMQAAGVRMVGIPDVVGTMYSISYDAK